MKDIPTKDLPTAVKRLAKTRKHVVFIRCQAWTEVRPPSWDGRRDHYLRDIVTGGQLPIYYDNAPWTRVDLAPGPRPSSWPLATLSTLEPLTKGKAMKDIPTKDLPTAVKQLAKTRKRDVFIRCREWFEVRPPSWDGGSRDAHDLRDIATGGQLPIDYDSVSWPNVPKPTRVDLAPGPRPGFAPAEAAPRVLPCLISGGTFRGKPAHLTFTVYNLLALWGIVCDLEPATPAGILADWAIEKADREDVARWILVHFEPSEVM